MEQKEESDNKEDNQTTQIAEEKTETVTIAEKYLTQIANLEKQILSLEDSILRKAADSENFRKRLNKEKEEIVKYANWKLAQDLIEIVDIFEKTINSSEQIKNNIDENPAIKAIFDGVLLCEKELTSVLKKHGISRIVPAEGDAFDHAYHQAMLEVDNTDHDVGAITQIFQNGYTYNERLLRPAMVAVAKK